MRAAVVAAVAPCAALAVNFLPPLDGRIDDELAQGMPAETCAARILKGVAQGRPELAGGGPRVRATYAMRFFPRWFFRLVR